MLVSKLKKFTKRNLRSLFFCVGLFLTIERSFECLLKYSHDNLGTKVKMVKNIDTLLPSFVICATSAYNQR